MDNIIKRDSYNNSDIKFDEMLENSTELVLETIAILEKKYNKENYLILSNFDNISEGIVSSNNFKKENLSKDEEKLFLKFVRKRFFNKKDMIEYITREQKIGNEIKKGLRAHDIAVIDKNTNKIISLFECKDFPQLIFYPETGLPIFYIEKLTLLKKIFEKQQGQAIQQFFVFKDNLELIENRNKRMINLRTIQEPYFIEFKDQDLNKLKVKRNSKKQTIETYFLNKIKKDIPKEALEQHVWNIEEMELLKNLQVKNKGIDINEPKY